MTEKRVDVEELMKEDWRDLGFYYDFDERISVNQWRLYGSKAGLSRLVQLLDDYISKPRHAEPSEHDHYGPYWYFKLRTWHEPMITDDGIAGTLEDLKFLGERISAKLAATSPGQTFEISKEYGKNNTVTFRLFVMADDFDPVSLDELIVSGRQAVVNAQHEAKRS